VNTATTSKVRSLAASLLLASARELLFRLRQEYREANEDSWTLGMCVELSGPGNPSTVPFARRPSRSLRTEDREDGESTDDPVTRRCTLPERQLTDTSGVGQRRTTTPLVRVRRRGGVGIAREGTRERKRITNL
jgi:hypothetical protein